MARPDLRRSGRPPPRVRVHPAPTSAPRTHRSRYSPVVAVFADQDGGLALDTSFGRFPKTGGALPEPGPARFQRLLEDRAVLGFRAAAVQGRLTLQRFDHIAGN